MLRIRVLLTETQLLSDFKLDYHKWKKKLKITTMTSVFSKGGEV